MRITNTMTMNKMLLNINKNVNHIDKLYTQYTSGKKIRYPSDNPIIASRALKFRTSVSMTEQFMRNVEQGISWIGITEQGFVNVLDAMTSIRERCVYGATGTLEYSDKQKIMEEIKAFADQIGAEMNIQYAGRYVFSGFKTDEPPILEDDEPDSAYEIHQNLGFNDIERVYQYYKPSVEDAPEPIEVYRLKLPYKQIDGNITIEMKDSNGDVIAGTPINVIKMSRGDQDAYDPTPPDVHYIEETGELILTSDLVGDFKVANDAVLNVVYTKEGFSKGEPNPRVYYTCFDVTDTANPIPYNIEYQGANQNIVFSNQDLKFEFGVNTRIKINNLAKDVYTSSLYSDIMALYDIVSGISITSDVILQEKYSTGEYANLSDAERNELINDQITQEQQVYAGVMQSMFSNVIAIIDKHDSNISVENTNLGSRTVRLNLIKDRLESDRISYTELMSDNENVDYLEVIMNLKTAESVYNAALNAGAKISQITLVDFIR